MEQETIDRQTLVNYLLGKIPEADHLSLSERFFVDEEQFDQLLAVQADLVDQYVRGQLSPEEARGLEGYLNRLPNGHHKIAASQALMKIVAEEHSAAATKQQLSEWWRSFVPFGRPQLRLVYSLMAALIVFVIGVIWLINYNTQQSLEEKAASGQKPSGEQPPQLGKLQQESASKVEEALGSRVPVQAPRDHSPRNLVSWRLTPSMRGSSALAKSFSRSGEKFVQLIAPIENREKYTEYRALLRTTEDNTILEDRAFHRLGSKRSYKVPLETSKLPPATYRLTLFLRTAAADDVSYDYFFKVVK